MKIALLGHGVVGRGVDQIVSTCTQGMEVSRILELPDRLSDPRMTSSFDDIVNDPTIEAVVECMGGIEPAHTFIMAALAAGKSVVTSNKAVVAAHFEEFVQQAAASGASLLIEATCGGGIPWIASIQKALRIDEVTRISGIMNGTTNYLVDTMAKTGEDFSAVLARAQVLGYAERNPSDDIDGVDVKNKTIIAASVAFRTCCVREFPVMGIGNLTKADMRLFAGRDRVVKLLGRAVQRDGRYAVSVEPVALPMRSLEANVPSNFNLVTLEGATVGELKFYGQGAGSLPTGNAMVQDLLDLRDGRRPAYDFSRQLDYDPSLLAGDYVLRTSAAAPAGAIPFARGAWVMRNRTAAEARSILDEALVDDPTSLIALLPQED